LRRIDNRRGEQRPINAAVANGKRAALEFLKLELVCLRTAREVSDGGFHFGKAHALGAAQDRHDQPLVAANSYGDVIVIVVHYVGSANLRVDLRDELERVDGSLDEEGHEPEL